ncbi:hypothetical protein AAVH_17179 [Aphelenchoides avenae]|nr:hypothetical protein AAVH_17179 [Aphelenchus avenae]
MPKHLSGPRLRQTLRLRRYRRTYHCCIRRQSIADEDARAAADVAVTKDLLPRLMASTTPGPSAPTRSPNKDRERNQ